MTTGTVKWFHESKGFGFIAQDAGGADVFCHHTSILAEGHRTLTEGQKVEFEVVTGPRGPQAKGVRVLAAVAAAPAVAVAPAVAAAPAAPAA